MKISTQQLKGINTNHLQSGNKLDIYIIKTTIKVTTDHFAAIASKEGSKELFFIKSHLTENGKKLIKREYANQKFFLKLTQNNTNCGFNFLNPILKNDLLIYPKLSDKTTWMSQDNPENHNFSPKTAKIEDYIENFMQFERIAHSINYNSLPKEIINFNEFRQGDLLNKLNNNSTYLLKKELISQSEANLAKELLDRYPKNTWSYQHGDLVPWHIAKTREGKYILVDLGWARWAPKYWDIAYYILQMVGYANNEEDALKMIITAQKSFKDDPNFNNLLKPIILYRMMRLARELNEQHKSPEQAKKVIKFVRTHFSK